MIIAIIKWVTLTTFNRIRHLVLDEADKLMDLGFLEQTDEIFAACSGPNVRKYMFSATFTGQVEDLAKTVMKDPIQVVIGSRYAKRFGGMYLLITHGTCRNAATETIKQELIFTGNEAGKMVALRQYIQKGIKPPVLIFVQSIDRAKELFHELVYDGINVEVIHSDRTQAQVWKKKVFHLCHVYLYAISVTISSINSVWAIFGY